MASSQPLTLTSSSLPFIILGIVRYRPEDEYGDAAGEYGDMLEGNPNLNLLKGAESVRTGELWFDFKSIDILTKNTLGSTKSDNQPKSLI